MNAALSLLVASLLGALPQQGELRQLVAPWDRPDSPGGAVAVVRDGKLDVAFAFGMADLADGRANTTATGFYLASVAKPFTAACAVIASRGGAMDLDASIGAHFPELPVAFSKPSLRQLLQHRSGIPDIYDVVIAADLGPQEVGSNEAALALLARLERPCFPAGERFLYCNSGYVLLAEALARTAKKPFPEVARELVLEPLEISGTWFLGESERAPRARLYTESEGAWTESTHRPGLLGPGGMWSTLDDLVRFECAWQSGRFPEAEVRRELLAAPKGGENPSLGPYALGWMLQSLSGHRVERHFGGGFGASADLLRLPDDGLAVIVLSNASTLNAPTIARQIASEVLGASLEPGEPLDEPAELSAEERARFGRIWIDSATDELWVVTPKPDRFALATLGDFKVSLQAQSDVRLRSIDSQIPVELEVQDDGRLAVEVAGEARALLEPIFFPPSGLPALEEYAGAYRCAALDARISFAPQGKVLAFVQERPLLQVPPFLPVARDLFLCDLGAQLRFQRDEEGRVAGVTVRVNRSGPLEFVRE